MNFQRNLSNLITLILVILTSALFAPEVGAQSNATIIIPSIEVNAPIVPVHIRAFPNGEVTWDVGGLHMTAGYFTGLPWFGSGSNTVLGGHSALAQGQADVFYRLDQVQIGDEVIAIENGNERHYIVTNTYRANQHDLTPIYPTEHEQLTLITCDLSSYNSSTGYYNDRFVVVALPSG
jgi:LPXTG-site transpeptidase (sortase) family protein